MPALVFFLSSYDANLSHFYCVIIQFPNMGGSFLGEGFRI